MGLEVEQVAFVTKIITGGGGNSVEEGPHSTSLARSEAVTDVELVETSHVLT